MTKSRKLMKSTIRDLFKRAFNNNPNLMTPEILDYGQCGDLVWELSKGEGFRNRETGLCPPIWGVSVLQVSLADTSHPPVVRHDLSQCVFDIREAQAFIADGCVPHLKTDALAALVEQGETEGLG